MIVRFVSSEEMNEPLDDMVGGGEGRGGIGGRCLWIKRKNRRRWSQIGLQAKRLVRYHLAFNFQSFCLYPQSSHAQIAFIMPQKYSRTIAIPTSTLRTVRYFYQYYRRLYHTQCLGVYVNQTLDLSLLLSQGHTAILMDSAS